MISFGNRLIVFVCICLLGIVVQAQDKKQIRHENKQFFKALNYAESEDYEKAIGVLKELVNDSPEFMEAYLQLGLCYLNTNTGADSAIVVLKHGLEQMSAGEQSDTLGLDFFRVLGEAYQVTLQPDSAIMVYDELLNRMVGYERDDIEEVELEITKCENAKVFLANPIKLTITNLGKEVNSRYDDHSPLVNVYESLLMFTSRRRQGKLPVLIDGQYPEKVYYTLNDSIDWDIQGN